MFNLLLDLVSKIPMFTTVFFLYLTNNFTGVLAKSTIATVNTYICTKSPSTVNLRSGPGKQYSVTHSVRTSKRFSVPSALVPINKSGVYAGTQPFVNSSVEKISFYSVAYLSKWERVKYNNTIVYVSSDFVCQVPP
jgi:hypothetical protein